MKRVRTSDWYLVTEREHDYHHYSQPTREQSARRNKYSFLKEESPLFFIEREYPESLDKPPGSLKMP